MKIEIKEIINPTTVRITTPDERWYQHPVSKKWIPSSTWIADYCPKGIGFYKWLASKGWDESQSIMESAGDRGSRVHNAIEYLIGGNEVKIDSEFPDSNGSVKELTTDEYECVMSFHSWAVKNKPEFIEIEKTVFNEKIGYAGTLDILAKIGEDIWIIDIKTSANIYLSHEAQVSSYFHADGITADKIGIIQVGYARNKNGYKFTELTDKFNVFLSAYEFWKDENLEKQPLQKDYPFSLKLQLK